MSLVRFVKMHGLGNDFVIIDKRKGNLEFSDSLIPVIADRRKGIGCDQLVYIENSLMADCKISFFNQDGSKSGACGNATRCVARIISDEMDSAQVNIETDAGIIECFRIKNNLVACNMGRAIYDWHSIPLSKQVTTDKLPLKFGKLKHPVALSVGNPHVVFFVDDINNKDFLKFAPKIETHPLFPEKVNVSIAKIISKDQISLRVWERGVGETMACGTAACATASAAIHKQLTNNSVAINLAGGELHVEIQENGKIILSGECEHVFSGQFNVF